MTIANGLTWVNAVLGFSVTRVSGLWGWGEEEEYLKM